MKKSFLQIAQDAANDRALTESDYRTILHWFGQSSCYFPTGEEKEQARSAFAWLRQNALRPDGSSPQPEDLTGCAAAFAAECRLPETTAQRLTAEFLRRVNGASPIIIGIEGLDGSGKTVQAKRLYDVLVRRGKKVCLIDFPQYDSFFGQEIGTFLSGTGAVSAMELDEKSMCLWYALDRWKTIGSARLEQYDYVIFNRYTLSSVVYQTARRHHGYDRGFADWILRLEHTQLGLPVPDLYLYLDIRTDFCSGNVLKKGERGYVDGLDVYESSTSLLACCDGVYKSLAEEISELRLLKCIDDEGNLKSIEETGANIVACLQENGLLGDPA